jgi:hypothetical protein
MAPHVIRETQPRSADGTDWNQKGGRRSNLVIADSGTAAELLVFPATESLARGSRFHYREIVWVVTGNRRDSGILVAEPSPQ